MKFCTPLKRSQQGGGGAKAISVSESFKLCEGGEVMSEGRL